MMRVTPITIRVLDITGVDEANRQDAKEYQLANVLMKTPGMFPSWRQAGLWFVKWAGLALLFYLFVVGVCFL